MAPPEMHIDDQAENGGKETPDREERLCVKPVGDKKEDQHHQAKEPDLRVGGEEADHAGGSNIGHYHRPIIEKWRHIDDMLIHNRYKRLCSNQLQQQHGNHHAGNTEAPHHTLSPRPDCSHRLHQRNGIRHKDRPDQVRKHGECIGRAGFQQRHFVLD